MDFSVTFRKSWNLTHRSLFTEYQQLLVNMKYNELIMSIHACVGSGDCLICVGYSIRVTGRVYELLRYNVAIVYDVTSGRYRTDNPTINYIGTYNAYASHTLHTSLYPTL